VSISRRAPFAIAGDLERLSLEKAYVHSRA
jgi:hypothetical protein